MKDVTCAISPCPNDIYIFYGWLKKHVGNDCPLDIVFRDISSLNMLAQEKKTSLIKLSIPTFFSLENHYELLPVGCALGHGVGPKLIGSKKKKEIRRVAIPGRGTTAHFLFLLFFHEIEIVFCTYDQIFKLIHDAQVDGGVIIHESRFTFESQGFREIADLGELWEKKYAYPLPLGGLALSKMIELKMRQRIVEILKESLFYAKKNREKMSDFLLSHAQEKDPEVVQKHIDLYVNDETISLSKKGEEAIACMREEYSRKMTTL